MQISHLSRVQEASVGASRFFGPNVLTRQALGSKQEDSDGPPHPPAAPPGSLHGTPLLLLPGVLPPALLQASFQALVLLQSSEENAAVSQAVGGLDPAGGSHPLSLASMWWTSWSLWLTSETSSWSSRCSRCWWAWDFCQSAAQRHQRGSGGPQLKQKAANLLSGSSPTF